MESDYKSQEEIIEVSKTNDQVYENEDTGQVIFGGQVFKNKEEFLKWANAMEKSSKFFKKLNPKNWFRKS